MPYHDQKEAWLRSRAAFHKRQGGKIENEDDDLLSRFKLIRLRRISLAETKMSPRPYTHLLGTIR
jgi:hypothetical protein